MGGLPVILVNLIPEDEAETSIASYDRAPSPDYPIAILLFLFISGGVGALVGDSISAVLRRVASRESHSSNGGPRFRHNIAELLLFRDAKRLFSPPFFLL